ncbi:hypothetical protein AFL01nite_25570 [Aeromicrobium flavum]|uniref:Gram-positive cocci surface proteins LPxTG domain-containing protein n=1 Tax=Aeromicrobium flavum TaxID=416568 RepID=A0A512HXW7_9ACTN|nr:hypothetical protein [Aeromicrobium flavum]GEO90230.1 hypothetical protein AFL01nite_25570 [Aeromicrobium flavum]
MRLRLVRALAAVLLGTAAGVVGATAPAHAAACAAGTGVTVVVGSSVGCDADGGGRAADNFAAAGHSLKYASRAPGFVCRVDGAPASDPCVDAAPADAYWGLFWADGKSGSWVYSSLGVTALKVPTGGAVAFVFQDSSSKRFPSVKPPVAVPAAAAPTAGSSDAGTGTRDRTKGSKDSPSKSSGAREEPAAGGAAVPAPTSPSAAATTAPMATPSTPATPATPSATATPAAGDAARAAGGSAESVRPLGAEAEESGTSPAALVAAGVVVALLAAGGGIVWRRRRGV